MDGDAELTANFESKLEVQDKNEDKEVGKEGEEVSTEHTREEDVECRCREKTRPRIKAAGQQTRWKITTKERLRRRCSQSIKRSQLWFPVPRNDQEMNCPIQLFLDSASP